MKILTVTEPFGGYAKGDQIIDAEAIAGALETNSSQVVAVEVTDPAPSNSKDTGKDAAQS